MNKVEMSLPEIQELENEMLFTVSKICDENNITYYLNAGSVLGAVRHKGPIPWDTDVDILIFFHDVPRFIKACKSSLPDNMYIDHYSINPNTYILFPRIGIRGYRTDRIHIDCFPLVGLPDDKNRQVEFSKKSDFIKKLYLLKKTSLVRDNILKSLFLTLGKCVLLPFTDKKIIEKFVNHCSQYSSENAEYVMNPCGHYGVKNILSRDVFGEGLFVNYADFKVRIPKKYEEYLKHYYGEYTNYPSSWQEEMKKKYFVYKSE